MRLKTLLACGSVAVAIAALPTCAAAATPSSGTVSPGGSLTWQGDFFAVASNVSGTTGNPPACPGDPGAIPGVHQCDTFELTVSAPPGYWNTHKGGVSIDINWGDPGNDFDLYVYRKPPPGQALGNPVGSSTQGNTTDEHVLLYQPDGTYLVRVVPFQVTGSDYTGKVGSFSLAPIPSVPGGVDQFRASHDQYNSHSEPHIAMNPLNPGQLVAGSKMYQNLEAYKFKIGTYASSDGGKAWRDNGHLPGYPVQTGNEGSGYYLTSDVWTAWDDEGNAYAMVLDNPPGSATDAGWGMTLHKSTDGGRTWGPRVPIEEKSDPATKLAALSDKNALAIDNYGPDHDGKTGNMYACWSEDVPVANVAVVVKRSTDGGQTWSGKTPISGADRTVLGCFPVVAPPAAPGQPGIVYVFWLDFGMSRLRMAKSTDGGQSWSPPQTVTAINRVDQFPNSAFRVDSLPTAGVDPGDGTLYVAWADLHQNASGACPPDSTAPPGQVCDSDVKIIRSSDGGSSWSAPARVNQDPIGNGKDQFEPQLAVTPGGQLDMMWFDRRNDPQDFYADTFLGRSNDKGGSWHETRVTKSMWDPSINPPISPSGQFIGDYQGMTASDCSAVPFWQDTTAANLPTTDPSYSPWQETYSAILPNTTAFGGVASPRNLPSDCSPAALARTRFALGGRFVISRRAVKLTRNGIARIRVSCRTPMRCGGKIALAAEQRVHSSRKSKVRRRKLGSARFRIPTRHRNFVIKVRLGRTQQALVRRSRRVRIAATADVRIGNDIRGRVARKLWLYRPSRR